MFIYLAMFAASAFLLYLSRRVKNKRVRKLFVIVALLLPSLMAAFRATSVGTDYEVYGISFFNTARRSSNILDYFATMSLTGNTDYGFYTIVYICSLFTKETMLEMFAIQIITVGFLYLGFCRCEERYGTPVWLAMLLYYFCLYNASLNIMRQCLAVAFSFYAFTFIWKKKYVPYVIFMVIAFLMHSSAIVAVLILILYKFLQTQKARSEWSQIVRAVIIVAVMVVAVMSLSQIVTVLVNLGLVRSTFLEYVAGGSYSNLGSEVSFSITNLFIQLCYLAGFALYYRIMNRRNMDSLFFSMCSLIVLVINIFSPMFATYVFRVAYYFIPLQVVGLSNIAVVNKRASKRIWILFVIILMFIAWYRLVVQGLGHETIPYELYWN